MVIEPRPDHGFAQVQNCVPAEVQVTQEVSKTYGVVLNGGANNTITITAPKCKYRNVGIGDREGVRAYEIPFAMARNAGDDELSIAQS